MVKFSNKRIAWLYVFFSLIPGGKENNKSKNDENRNLLAKTTPSRFDPTPPPEWSVELAKQIPECPICGELEPVHCVQVECSHVTCYKCALRIREYMGDKRCPICKVENEKIIITKKPKYFLGDSWGINDTLKIVERVKDGISRAKHYEDNFKVKFDAYGIAYDQKEQKQLRKAVDEMFSYKCWICNSPNFATLWDLEMHLQNHHQKRFCNVCLYGRDCFLREQMLYKSKHEVYRFDWTSRLFWLVDITP